MGEGVEDPDGGPGAGEIGAGSGQEGEASPGEGVEEAEWNPKVSFRAVRDPKMEDPAGGEAKEGDRVRGNPLKGLTLALLVVGILSKLLNQNGFVLTSPGMPAEGPSLHIVLHGSFGVVVIG